MLFWLCAAALTAIAVMSMFAPLARRAHVERGASDARSETILFVTLATGVPLAALFVYLLEGKPYLPDRPYASREAERVAAGLPSDEEKALVGELALRMSEHPQDPRGWLLLGNAYLHQQRAVEAISAFRNGLRHAPSDAALLSGLGEALVVRAGGEVTAEAGEAFAGALKTDPSNAPAAYFLSLEKAQHRDIASAVQGWKTLLSENPPEPWRSLAQAALSEAKTESDP